MMYGWTPNLLPNPDSPIRICRTHFLRAPTSQIRSVPVLGATITPSDQASGIGHEEPAHPFSFCTLPSYSRYFKSHPQLVTCTRKRCRPCMILVPPPRLHHATVPVAHVLNTRLQAPRFNSFKFTFGTILVFPVRNYPPSVGHVYQNTLRY
jgi:hypothetical protein